MTNDRDTDTCDTWLTYAEAAKRLGVSANAIKQRVKRGALLATRGNDGQPRVSLPVRHGDTDTAKQNRPTPTPATPADPMVALSKALEMVAIERARADQQLVEERRRHESEIERTIGQICAERTFWIERADAAEVRAEAAEERLHQAILDRTKQSRPWWRRWVG